VTDWTAAGGHGSDARLRTSEDLARETLVLKPSGDGHIQGSGDGASVANQYESTLRAALVKDPENFAANHRLGEFYLRENRCSEAIPLLQTAYQKNPADYGNEYDLAQAYRGAGNFSQARDHAEKMLVHEDNADLHRLMGDIDEELGDPLAAVREDEKAVRLDPSEQNYFEWGSELLLHRAVQPATEVFETGVKAHPKSERMLAALGAALFAGGLYDEAALRVCDASDLNPADSAPYIFLGKIEKAAPSPLVCVEPKLKRFLQQQPGNAFANYYYAMAIWKRRQPSENPESLQAVEELLAKAVTIDPNLDDAYLQLGILCASRHDFEKAIDFYKKAIAANPQLSAAHYRLGVAYERTGQSAEATREFQLHDEIEKQQAAVVDRQRREIKQFLIVLKVEPTSPLPN
jgi:tetratricopeptide (TPR) repeat protein